MGELRVKVVSASLNPVDAKYSLWGPLFPQELFLESNAFVIGVDGAGVVDKVFSENSRWKIGDRVCFHAFLRDGHGSFAEYAIIKESVASLIPHNISFEQASALPCAGYTAYKALHKKMRVCQNSSILIAGGNGGVGGFAVQLAKAAGMSPIIATCSRSSSERVLRLGATHTIDYNNDDILATLKLICPEGVDYFIDTVSSDSVTSLLSGVRYDGHIATVAGSVQRKNDDSYLMGWSIHDISLGMAAYVGQNPELLSQMGDEMLALVSQGVIDPMIEKTVELSEVPAIIDEVLKGKTRGKVSIKI